MMSLLNQAAVEALCSATYLENYLDCVENMPDDLQRSVSEMRELDLRCNDHLKDIENYKVTYLNETDNSLRKRALIQIQRALIKCQEIGDEKLQLVAVVIEHIENRTRQLEQDLENLDPSVGKDTTVDREKEVTLTTNNNTANKKEKEERAEKAGVKRQRRQRTHHDSISKEEEKKEEKEKPKKKKKRKVKKEDKGEKSPPIEPPIDPDEPTYCLCEQVSYGEMIGCDNDDCVIEWFHFQCVGLNTKPKGKWYCPQCRGDKSNVRRQDK